MKFTIRRKIFIFTAALSVALILVSVLVSSLIFGARVSNDAKTLCNDSAKTLETYFETFDTQVKTSGETENLIFYYKNKLSEIYTSNRETIEEMSALDSYDKEQKARKDEYFSDITAALFGGGQLIGTSIDVMFFRGNYAEAVEEIKRIASIEGVFDCCVYYFDAEHGNLVYMFDSSSKTLPEYNPPCSVEKASKIFSEKIAAADAVTVVSSGDIFAGCAPIKVNGETLAYVTIDYSIDRLVDTQREFILTLVLIMLAATVVILVLYLFFADRFFVRNVTRLSVAAREFTSRMEGGEIAPVDAGIKAKDEIGDLSDDFFVLQNKVASFAEDIANKTVEEERMRAELNVASKIQMQSLPSKPLITHEISLSSFIKPAKEVGGDLFDYFVTEQGKIFFVIADVSGKGVPAALFMMRGKEIIRSCAKTGMNAAKIADTANRELCKNNGEGLFITAFIGIYDPQTQTLSFARAGHEQPFLLRNGVAEKIGEESNFVLGVFDGVPFVEDRLELRRGDKMLFYTDGLNEGINDKNEEFGYDRIQEALESGESDILACVYERALNFYGEVEQFDDITMLLLECVKADAVTLRSPKYEDIPAVTDRINEFVKGYDADKIAELDVIIDELINNYISYAFKDVKKPRLDIEIRLSDGVAELSFTDNGTLFDPLKLQPPSAESDINDRPVGGFGIAIVKSVSDGVFYRVFCGENRFTVIKNLNG